MAEFEHWDDAYAAEMRRVHYQFPHDQDVMALLVEALMMRTVRRLWDLKTGTPAPGSEALGSCERVIALADEAGAPPPPALLHLHIHLLGMSTLPERALRSADRLGGMCPDAGHLNHVPAHIYVRCGGWILDGGQLPRPACPTGEKPRLAHIRVGACRVRMNRF